MEQTLKHTLTLISSQKEIYFLLNQVLLEPGAVNE